MDFYRTLKIFILEIVRSLSFAAQLLSHPQRYTHEIFCLIHPSNTLSHQGPVRRLQNKAGDQNLYYHLNDLNTEIIPASTSGNMQSRYVPWEPHANRDKIFFCILPYLNISAFSWLKVFYPVHYPTRDPLGLLKQRVTIFTIT